MTEAPVKQLQFQILPQDGYILMTLSGVTEPVGMKAATEALLKTSQETGIKNVLYDASALEVSTAANRRLSIQYAKQVQQQMDQMASYVTKPMLAFTANLIYRLSGNKRAKVFNNREAAIKWLTNPG